ncbi:MAG: TIGR00282 family metallophosphoesterase [Alphaproteobacteria bacterium]
MRFLVCGDIMGRAGREVVIAQVPRLRGELRLDFVVANGENAAHGFGITPAICRDLYEAGVDAITTGNHVWDQREIIPYIGDDPRLLRPQNYPSGAPGHGTLTLTGDSGKRLLVVHVQTRLFMDAIDDPFACLSGELAMYRLGEDVEAILVDVHGEATSEKMAVAHHVDGRVSAVVGTHTHVPTADAQILPGGTAYLTDIGMCGDYDSVIGMKKGPAIERFVTKMPTERLSPAEGEATLCAVFIETDDVTGLARRIEPVRIGGRLSEARPG